MPQTRAEIIAMILDRFPEFTVGDVFRATAATFISLAEDDDWEVEQCAVGIQYYGCDTWGLVETAELTDGLSALDFSLNDEDILLWLKCLAEHAQTSLPVQITIHRVDDFFVLKLAESDELIAFVNCDVSSDVPASLMLPIATSRSGIFWGDAFVPNFTMLVQACSRLSWTIAPCGSRDGPGS